MFLLRLQRSSDFTLTPSLSDIVKNSLHRRCNYVLPLEKRAARVRSRIEYIIQPKLQQRRYYSSTFDLQRNEKAGAAEWRVVERVARHELLQPRRELLRGQISCVVKRLAPTLKLFACGLIIHVLHHTPPFTAGSWATTQTSTYIYLPSASCNRSEYSASNTSLVLVFR